MSELGKFWPDLVVPEGERERERWVNVAFCATCIADLDDPCNDVMFLRCLLSTYFSDVPDHPPPADDVDAYAKYAVKLLVKVMIGRGGA